MLRQATDADLNQVEEGYQKHFLHEKEHGAFTVFQEGVYPTRADAAKALSKGALHVYDENGDILGSIIVDRNQPDEYETIDWPSRAPALKPQGKASAPLSSSMRWKERGNIPMKW